MKLSSLLKSTKKTKQKIDIFKIYIYDLNKMIKIEIIAQFFISSRFVLLTNIHGIINLFSFYKQIYTLLFGKDDWLKKLKNLIITAENIFMTTEMK